MYLVGEAHSMAIANWRVMFLICGGATLLVGVLFIFAMPVDTTTAWFLNESERRIATERLALDRETRDRSHFDKAQVTEALLDPTTWMYFLMALFICIPSPILKVTISHPERNLNLNVVSQFSSLVINGFGFNQFQTMLVGLPCGAMEILVVWIAALGMRYTKNMRSFWGILLTLVPLIGSALMMSIPKSEKWGIVVSTWLAACSSSLMVITNSMIATNVKGNTKKSVVSAVFFVGYSVGCISGPQLWQAQDAPRYIKGCISSLVSWALLVVTFAVYYFYLKRRNNKRAPLLLAVEADAETDGEKIGSYIGVEVDSDLTDGQDLKFIYTL